MSSRAGHFISRHMGCQYGLGNSGRVENLSSGWDCHVSSVSRLLFAVYEHRWLLFVGVCIFNVVFPSLTVLCRSSLCMAVVGNWGISPGFSYSGGSHVLAGRACITIKYIP